MPPPGNASEAADGVRSITVILNPASGRGQGAKRRPELESLLERFLKDRSASISWQIVETTSQGAATALAAEAARQGIHLVAAAGGDGTLSEVLNGLMGTQTRLGLLPLGTGNDFARTLNIGTDLSQAVQTLCSGVPRPVDVGQTQGRYFINVAGCGFDAACAERVNKGYRYLRGTAAYIAAVYQTLMTYRPSRICLTLDGETRELRAMLCSVANAQTYGGGMKIAPHARLNDGLLDVCLVTTTSRREFLAAFPRVFRGTHITHPAFETHRARKIHIECEPAQPVLVDGEIVGTTPAEFSVLPQAITVMTPQNLTGNAFLTD